MNQNFYTILRHYNKCIGGRVGSLLIYIGKRGRVGEQTTVRKGSGMERVEEDVTCIREGSAGDCAHVTTEWIVTLPILQNWYRSYILLRGNMYRRGVS